MADMKALGRATYDAYWAARGGIPLGVYADQTEQGKRAWEAAASTAMGLDKAAASMVPVTLHRDRWLRLLGWIAAHGTTDDPAWLADSIGVIERQIRRGDATDE